MSGGGGGNPISQYVIPGIETLAGGVSEFFAPGNPIGISAMGSGIGQLAGGAAGGSQGQGLGGLLGGLGGGLGSGMFGGASGGGGGLSGLFGGADSSGGLGGLGSLLGGGGSQGQQFAPTPQLGGGGGMQPAGSLAGMPFFSADQYANYGPNAPGSTGPGFGNSASFAPPVPPPAALNPAGTGAGAVPTGNLSPTGSGGVTMSPSSAANLQAAGFTPQDIQAAQGMGGTPWYGNPAYWQGAGTVGAAYLKYLSEGKQQELAHPFQSAVLAPTYNPLAGVKSSPITPPTLTV